MNTTTQPLLALGLAAAAWCAPPACAADIFNFDFESGQLPPWLTATTGGSGSTDVGDHNNSKMAYVQHTGIWQHSLSYDFDFLAPAKLTFTMHAVAVPNGITNAGAGVVISFNNSLNVSLGSLGLWNVTNPGALTGSNFFVDDLQHDYANTLATFAQQAGLSNLANVTKVSLRFVAYGETSGSRSSSATVWFDNVSLAVVPEPTPQALLLTGLALMGVATRARRWQAQA